MDPSEESLSAMWILSFLMAPFLHQHVVNAEQNSSVENIPTAFTCIHIACFQDPMAFGFLQ